jgi:hypothetical protein
MTPYQYLSIAQNFNQLEYIEINFDRVTLSYLPENRFSSKAKMYRYHQIEEMMAPDDIISASWLRRFFGLRLSCPDDFNIFTRNSIFQQG